MLIAADLPDDVNTLRALVLQQAREIDTLKAAQAEVERLRAILEAFQRHRFGRRSEQLDPDQLQLGLEDVETALAGAEAASEVKADRTSARRPRKTNRGSAISCRSTATVATVRLPAGVSRSGSPSAGHNVRRKFFDLTGSPVAIEVLRRIASLYKIGRFEKPLAFPALGWFSASFEEEARNGRAARVL